MSETQQPSYGYQTDDAKVNPFNFGLNAGRAFLTKFEWIPNGGKDGAEQEALEIIFNVNGVDKSHRQFPVTKAFLKGGGETTDPKAPEFQEAFSDFNAIITHILHAFVDSDSIKAAMSIPISSFKQFCQVAMSIPPKNYKEIPLDIFMQWEWQLRDGQEKTYLTIPSKMKYGKWLAPAQAGIWEEHRVENPADTVREALYYTNAEGNKHPFVKNGWFMNSNFAKQQRADGRTAEEVAASTKSTTSANGTTGEAPKTAPPPAAKPSTW